jgi:hypothetical protein
MEGANSSSSEMTRVAVRLPPFWTEPPAAWFAQAEAQFLLAGISNELTKFYRMISQLDQQCVIEVEDIINSPPQQHPYTALKTELVRRLCSLRDQRTRQLLILEKIGDIKPSQFLKHPRRLAPDIPNNYLRILWTSRLPNNIQIILAGMPEVGLDAVALCADLIIQAVSPSTVASISPEPDYTELLQSIRDLSSQLANLTADRNRPNSKDRCSRSSNRQSNFSDRRSRSNSASSSTHRSPSAHDTTNNYCWYHQRYGDRAQSCSQPCTYSRSPSRHDAATTSCWYYRRFGARAQNYIGAMHLPPPKESRTPDVNSGARQH